MSAPTIDDAIAEMKKLAAIFRSFNNSEMMRSDVPYMLARDNFRADCIDVLIAEVRARMDDGK